MFLKSLTGFYPVRLRLYDIAVIHKSVSVVDSRGHNVNNERLEYLGDAILGAVIADYLYNRFPHKDEGYLTQLRSRIVNRNYLTQLAVRTGLNRFMESKANFPNETSTIYGDVFEALIGAIYLDKGYDITKTFILKKVIAEYVDIEEIETNDTNYKSRLIEWGQKNKTKIDFTTKDNYDPKSKKPPFSSEAFVGDLLMGKGEGSSKKEAQQKASENALKKLAEKE